MFPAMLWRSRLRLIAAVCICLALTGVFYLYLPKDVSLTQGGLHISGTKQVRWTSSQTTITIIIRDFEDFENSIGETVRRIRETLGDGIRVLIVADSLPYPPLDLVNSPSTQILSLSPNLLKNDSRACGLEFVTTKYVLFMPDGVSINSLSQVNKMTTLLDARDDLKAVAIAIGDNPIECSSLNVSLKEWTVSFQIQKKKDLSLCSYIEGMHTLMIRTEALRSLVEPFARPFPYTFYVQATLKRWMVDILREEEGGFKIFHQLFTDFHSKWKRKQSQSERLNSFYSRAGIKQEILKSGDSNYFGCSKKTARCFGSVVKDMPQYLYEGKWTPPCCLHHLRECVAHVFGVLDSCKVRYWLEGGSLLGAARHGDIIPWDYDVDVGIYLNDLDKCHPLKQAKLEPYVDEEEYVWEKAREGEFYRVQYSETNHLHVDIFPFFSKDGIMTKNSWFDTHPQDTEFSESFLTPLTKIKFAGVEASAPNNVREFLEYKFGKNVIENPRYPNLQSPVL